MLRLLFQSLESLFGAGLDDVARVVYLAGALVLVLAALRPLWRLWADWRTERAGLEERWVGACTACGLTGPLWRGACSACGADLGLPWVVRWRTRGAAWLASPAWRRAARAYRLAGALLFLGAAGSALWTVVSPPGGGALHRLFAGLGFFALAVAGFAFGRALGPARRGIVARAGYMLHGMAAVGLLAVLLFLAGAARPPAETRLVAAAPRPNAEGEVGIEYLQLDHELLGFRRIVPLAYLGAERTPVDLAAPTRWAVAHFRAHADDWERRGLTVRLRRDMRRVTPGERYEIVESGGQVLIRRAGA
ncbi:MAG TPA: hypothetical protein VF406_05655 [Thermodesulfobacteriota bacterium]